MRKRWTEERRLQREHADWIVGHLRVHGPMTTREIIEALSSEGRPVQAHILVQSFAEVTVCDLHRQNRRRWTTTVDLGVPNR